MKRWILEMKHWKLFLLTTICSAFTGPKYLEALFYTIAVTSYLGWLFSIATFSTSSNLIRGKMNLLFFKINILILEVVLLLSLIDVWRTPSESFYSEFWDAVLLVLAFYTFFALFYVIRFTAKALVSLEFKDRTSFNKWLPYFIAMIFFPFGIWFIQPKVNRVFDKILREEDDKQLD